jgi:hypothetical protein
VFDLEIFENGRTTELSGRSCFPKMHQSNTHNIHYISLFLTLDVIFPEVKQMYLQVLN